jgi:hypothetical protein
MPIELTSAQAKTVAELTRELGGTVWLHQLAEGKDVYIAAAGETTSQRISVAGQASPATEWVPAPSPEDAR